MLASRDISPSAGKTTLCTLLVAAERVLVVGFGKLQNLAATASTGRVCR
jgi:hypothetical protein